MIRYVPNHSTISLSLKDEQIFESVEEMLQYLFDSWSRVVAYIGDKRPLRREEITVSKPLYNVPMFGLKNLYKVQNSRLPFCAGYYGER
jgi:hypothetical protein